MQTPHVLSFSETEIIASQIRTSHSDEQNEENARIGKHWHDFFKAHANQLNPTLPIFGVYTNYSSHSHESSYTHFIGQTNMGITGHHTHTFTIPAGNYLVFSSTGTMPSALIKTWSYIWNYFENSTQYSRTFTVDFEVHYVDRAEEVLIYVAIK